MNDETNKLRSIIGVLMIVVVVMAYYVGYFSSKLGFDAPFIPDSGKQQANVANAQAQQPEEEFKQVEEVPYLELKGDEVAKGNLNSNLVLVEFTDLQCPFCARFHPTVESAVQKNNIKLVTKHFPLSFHQFAKDYSVMFECLAKNNGSEQAYNFVSNLFIVNLQKQGSVTLEDGLGEAKKVGLSDATFNSCKSDTAILDKIQGNFDEGIKIGINGTPALYIMNTSSKKAVRVNGLAEESVLQAEIEKLK